MAQGCLQSSGSVIFSIQHSSLCQPQSRTGGKRVAKVPGFAQNILQRDCLLLLLYFKSKKTFPRHLRQVFPVYHSSEYGHLPSTNSIPVHEEIFVLPGMASSSIPNKGLGTSLLVLTTDNYP